MKCFFGIFLIFLLAGCDDCACLDDQCAPDDTDTDTGTDEPDAGDDAAVDDCALNSGQHCVCDTLGLLCEDDETVCSQLDGDDGDLGVCIYYTQSDECPDSDWGDSTIIINMGGGAQCWLSCEVDDDCPTDQSCLAEHDICYPNAA
jgi:hypothetical protein